MFFIFVFIYLVSDLTLSTVLDPVEICEEIEEQDNYRRDPLYEICDLSVFVDKHSEALIRMIHGHISTIEILAEAKQYSNFETSQAKKRILKRVIKKFIKRI